MHFNSVALMVSICDSTECSEMRCFISTFFKFSSGCSIRRVWENAEGLKFNQKNQLLAYVSNVNVLSEKKLHETWKVY